MSALITRRAAPWWLGFATFVALSALRVAPVFPPLPAELALEVKFPSGNPARTEPLISTGVFAQADFLVVNYLDRTTATFSYDSWGTGGPTSPPVTFKPGARHTLQVTLPSLAALPGTPRSATAPLRLVFDGREILRADVPFHSRPPAQIFFGTNPIGGNTAGAFFRGDLFAASGQTLRGGPSSYFPYTTRLSLWFAQRPADLPIIALLAVAGAWLARRLLVYFSGRRLRPVSASTTSAARPPLRAPHVTFGITAFLCTLTFAWVLTAGTWKIFFPDEFGNFYDYQARSFLAGHLDVPAAALGAEAFAFGGKLYGYFGPTPAVLRLPFVFLDLGFGLLTRPFLIAYFFASLAAVYALYLHATRLLSPASPQPSRPAVALLTITTGLGTTLLFLGSRAYIYHEANLCGIAFSLWSAWCSLRWLSTPTSRAWIPALALALLAVHARPPVGLFAFTLVGCVAATHLLRAWFAPEIENQKSKIKNSLRPVTIGLLSILGVFSFNALSYLKFRSFDGAPLKYHVQYHPARLAAIDGKNFHVANFRYNFDGYVWRANFLLRPTFPYFYADGRNPNDYPGAKIDLAEPTVALPYAMPAVVFLALLGGVRIFARRLPLRLPFILVALAALPMSFALFFAIAISHRYTADFCPPLLLLATFGLASLSHLTTALRRTLLAVLAVLVLLSAGINLAITLHYQAELVWGVPDGVKARYLALRKSADTFFGLPPHDR
jgi:hypothetical protein